MPGGLQVSTEILTSPVGTLSNQFSLLWICMGDFNEIILAEDVRTYVFHMLRTYVIILCNWLIL